MSVSRTRDGAHLLRVHESMLTDLSEAWSRPFQLRLGEAHADGTRDLEARPVEARRPALVDTDDMESLRSLYERTETHSHAARITGEGDE